MGADLRTSALTPRAGQSLRAVIRRRFPQAAALVRFVRTLPLRCRSAEAIFTSIHRRNAWRGEESASGPGSSREGTAALRRELPRLLAELGCTSLLDAPCGDLCWLEGAELLTRIDAERREAHRRPLVLDPRLSAAAQRHADDMLAQSYFAHRDRDGKTVRERARAAGYEWTAIGENIALDQQSVKEVVESWMRSPGHRENILDRRYTQTGIGLALGRDPKTGEYRVLWVQTFGLPR